MRKRSRPQPLCFIDNAHHASSAAAACDSSPPSLCCFPFFYLLLIAWIVLSTLNPTLSHYSGGYPWSVTWPSGVHADGNNGELRVEKNGVSPDRHENLLPCNESNPSSHTQLAIKNKTREPRSVQDLKCRPFLFKEVLFLTASPACCHSSSGSCKTRSRSFQAGFNFTGKNAARRHLSPHTSESRSESQQSQDSSNEGPLHHEGKFDVYRDGVVDDSKNSIHGHLEAQEGTHVHNNDDKEHQAHEHNIHEHGEDGGEHHVVVNVDKGEQQQAHTPLSRDELMQNETGLAAVTSDILNKIHPALTNLSKAHLRQEPGDGLYNYAADSKGAKILASNKETKGASNILNKDRDKYFRIPCNVETKFVDMELSEETLVVQIVIANHEFYSSNVREFEVLGSLAYPAEQWVSLGKFEAENSRVPQLFSLREPQWVRYLKLQMLSHYGSDFYCTLSMVEVYGVDAIESFLEDWIAEEAGGVGAQNLPSKEENTSVGNKGGSSMHSQNHPPEKDADSENEVDLLLTQKLENLNVEKAGDSAEGKGKNMEKPHPTGRPALDAVMKLLMQKVRSLEHKEPLFSQQVKDLDEKYKEVLRTQSKEKLMMMGKLEEAATEIANLNAVLQSMERKWNEERHSLQKDISNQVKTWNTDLIFLRYELNRMENKELVALAVSFFSIITIAGIQVLMLCVSVFKPGKENEILLLSCSRMLWVVPFLSCVLVVFVLSV